MTRKELSLVLAVNAVTKPVNVLAPAIVLVAALALGVLWLAPVAVVCWLALVTVTFFDEREAREAGSRARSAARREPPPVPRTTTRFAPEIAARVRAASAARAAITAEASDDVNREVAGLVLALQGHAERAQRIHAFLAEQPAADADALDRLRQRLAAMLTEMDEVVTTLQTVRAELLAVDGLGQTELAAQVSELRARVQVIFEN
ncbi:hypothetical protein [Solirubrobacter soli]|uniref:hypothetical protein n=1 Tax=Solirubrobacter soli TaxID=363832 RepID=UPI0004049C51|nr:hypothetical protein [Solirubrobacter soli]